MSKKFTASNGVEVWLNRAGVVCAEVLKGDDRVWTEAVREFFLHERDQELGRWRDPQEPDWVAYAGAEGAEEGLIVARESTGESHRYFRADDDLEKQEHSWESPFARTARRFYRSHPVPKPWHDAEPGEVWELTYRSPSQREVANRVMTCVDDGGNISFFNQYRLHTVHYTGIESARRIWPEVSDGA